MRVLSLSINPTSSKTLFRAVLSLLIFCLVDLSSDEIKVSHYYCVTVDVLPHSIPSYVMNFAVPSFVTYVDKY